MANKIRAKGWQSCYHRIQNEIEMLIMMTPTSELRNQLTELNMKLMEIGDFAKKQDEVL
jgi:hypothetical protein